MRQSLDTVVGLDRIHKSWLDYFAATAFGIGSISIYKVNRRPEINSLGR